MDEFEGETKENEAWVILIFSRILTTPIANPHTPIANPHTPIAKPHTLSLIRGMAAL